MKTVCIESPLAGDFARNIAYARACLRYCMEEGVSAYASHLLLPQVYNDLTPEQREAGIEAGLAMGDLCRERWFFVDLDISDGMRRGATRAAQRGQKERHIELGPDWAERYPSQPTPGFITGDAELQSVRTEYGKAVKSIDRMRERISELTRELSAAREEVGRLKDAQALRPMSEAPVDGTRVNLVFQGEWHLQEGFEPAWRMNFGVHLPRGRASGWFPLVEQYSEPDSPFPPGYATARSDAVADS